MTIRNQLRKDLEEDHSRLKKKSQGGKEHERVLGTEERAVWWGIVDDGTRGKK